MAKQSVTLRVPIASGWDGRTRLQVYTNFGSGAVDTSKPLLPRPMEVFPGQPVSRGFGARRFGLGRFGDGKPGRGGTAVFGRQRFGKTPFGNPTPFVEVTVDVAAAFGAWKFGVKAVDRFGNVQAGGAEEVTRVVSGTDPPPLKSFAVNGYDSQVDQVTFDFVKETE